MSNDEGMTKPERRKKCALALRHLSIRASFVIRHSFDFLLETSRASRWIKHGVPTKKSQIFCWQFPGQCSFSERIAGRLPMETCPVPYRKKTLSRLQHEK
jgi:hypothetical protein